MVVRSSWWRRSRRHRRRGRRGSLGVAAGAAAIASTASMPGRDLADDLVGVGRPRAAAAAASSRTMKNCEPTRVRLRSCGPSRPCPRPYVAVTGSSWIVYGGPPVPTSCGSTSGARPYWPSPPWITKPGHEAVEHDAVVPAALGERDEVAGRDRATGRRVDLDLDVALLGRDRHGPRLACGERLGLRGRAVGGHAARPATRRSGPRRTASGVAGATARRRRRSTPRRARAPRSPARRRG